MSLFYTNGGVKLMEIFISSERAARRVIVFWARGVFWGKSEVEPVEGGASTQTFALFAFPCSPLLTVNVDARANTGEPHGRNVSSGPGHLKKAYRSLGHFSSAYKAYEAYRPDRNTLISKYNELGP
jgi:hypothetical protein